MSTAAYDPEFTRQLNALAQATSSWLRQRNASDLTLLLLQYEKEAQSGRFHPYYAALYDDSLECLSGVFPAISARLSGTFSAATGLSATKTRLTLNLLLYWVLLFHSNNPQQIPSETGKASMLRAVFSKSVFAF